VKSDNTNKNQEISDSDKSAVVWVIISVIGIIFIAVFYFAYPLPGGEATISNFILIFLKEIIVISILGICFIYWLVKKIKNLLNHNYYMLRINKLII